jgi:hypothetical protein
MNYFGPTLNNWTVYIGVAMIKGKRLNNGNWLIPIIDCVVYGNDDREYMNKPDTRDLLIDDTRVMCVDVIARNYDEGIEALTNMGPWDTLYLDHDLSSYDKDGREMSGRDIMKFLLSNPKFAPKEIVCVSGNPIGKREIEHQIQDLKKLLEIQC